MMESLSRRQCMLLGAGLLARAEVTPMDGFFIRDHFGEPQLSLATWKLSVEGRVKHPFALTFSDLLDAPVTGLESVLECAGNSPAGNAVSAGLWQGVSLGKLLEQAGADPAGTVLLEGADEGQLLPGRTRTPYRRVVPQRKCRAPETLVAFKLNHRLLPQSHGFPARAVLPGWYGMDSVKWLRRIVVLGPDETPAGYNETGMDRLYCRLRRESAPERIGRILVKSMIVYPADEGKLAEGACVVQGYAWTGEGAVARVEVSADGGQSWHAARLEAASQPFTWNRWTWSWQAPAGEHTLMSRAYDRAGNTQPLAHDAGRLDSYELNWCAPVRCTVR
jgi:DMSO/TMAO reductase YedYZ molybdopterin-dependent catalytic subunit